MELYALTSNFLTDYLIEDKVSLIWTERYTNAGDMQLVLVPTKFYVDNLTPGTFLSIPDSQEVMVIENQLIENGLLKISGRSLLTILNQRYVWELNKDVPQVPYPPMPYKDSTKVPGYFISYVVNRFAIDVPDQSDNWGGEHSMNEQLERISILSLGAIDYSGSTESLTAPLGPIYDSIKPIAETYNIGISLYLLVPFNDGSYYLKFKTYQGKDRTSNQSVNKLMRLSQSLDEISDVKELRSNAEEITDVYMWTGLSLFRYGSASTGLVRRVKVIHPETTPELYYEQPDSSGSTRFFPKVSAYYFLKRYKALHIVDAKMNSFANYKFGVDYGLGDIIEYESSTSGVITNARVTEYIRSHDSSGEKAYPTIVVE